MRGPKGWKRTITRTTKWKKAKPGRYRIKPAALQAAGLPATSAVAPGTAKVKLKRKGRKRGAQARVTYTAPPPRCAAAGRVLYGVGDNASSQIGDGTTTDRLAPTEIATAAGGLRGATAFAAGTSTGYAVCADGSVWAWGQNGYGQLGNGTVGGVSPWPVRVSNLAGVVAVAAGDRHALALKSDGTVWAWGANDYGQLGNGNTTSAKIPVPSGVTGVTRIAAGHYASYALRADKTVRAWGIDTSGQLGDGAGFTNRSQPVPVQGLLNVSDIAGGRANGYALLEDGTVRAWGSGAEGALGADSFASAAVPVTVAGLTGVTDIGAGFATGYAVHADGSMSAWGSDTQGALGDGGPIGTEDAPLPVEVVGVTAATTVVSHGHTAYALRSDGTVAAWGAGLQGQLGNGALASSSTPVLAAVNGVVGVAARGATGDILR